VAEKWWNHVKTDIFFVELPGGIIWWDQPSSPARPPTRPWPPQPARRPAGSTTVYSGVLPNAPYKSGGQGGIVHACNLANCWCSWTVYRVRRHDLTRVPPPRRAPLHYSSSTHRAQPDAPARSSTSATSNTAQQQHHHIVNQADAPARSSTSAASNTAQQSHEPKSIQAPSSKSLQATAGTGGRRPELRGAWRAARKKS
jgi:hypothetical protein